MKLWGIFAIVLILALMADAQITRTATFENFTAGQSFRPSFTDPLSGITFFDSTYPLVGVFDIDGSLVGTYFNGGNYLTGGGGPVDGLGASFGFTAALPALADRVTLEAVYDGDSITNVLLQGFNSTGHVVTQAAGQASMSNPFTLEIDSAQYNISTFQVSVGGGFAGYDNISYTYLPEPSGLLLFGFAASMMGRTKGDANLYTDELKVTRTFTQKSKPNMLHLCLESY